MNEPQPSVGTPGLLPPASTSCPEGFQVTLRWTYRASEAGSNDGSYEVLLPVARETYALASGELAFSPLMPEEYADLVLQGPMEPVEHLAEQLRELTRQRGFLPRQEMENVIHLVRSLRYWSDAGRAGDDDQPKYPVQTLVDGGGDCEDFAILAAAILWTLGHPVSLIYLETAELAHMALGYQTEDMADGFAVMGPDDRRYVYVETVPTGAVPGELSEDLRHGLRRVVVVPL